MDDNLLGIHENQLTINEKPWQPMKKQRTWIKFHDDLWTSKYNQCKINENHCKSTQINKQSMLINEQQLKLHGKQFNINENQWTTTGEHYFKIYDHQLSNQWKSITHQQKAM